LAFADTTTPTEKIIEIVQPSGGEDKLCGMIKQIIYQPVGLFAFACSVTLQHPNDLLSV
jgi:hypothetical protein